MPDMTPVGDKIVPPNPMAGINAYAGMLGIKQAQQNLQTGALQQQQQQLETSKQLGVQDFFNRWDPSEHVGEDGTTDLDSALQSPAFKGAGNAKPAVMQALLDIKQKQLGAKQSLAGLNRELVTQLGNAAGAFAKDDDVMADEIDPATGVNGGRAKVNELLANFSKQSPDAARVAGIYQPLLQHVPPGKLSKALQALQLQAQSASEQQAQQNPAQLAVNTGAATNVYNVDKSTGLQPGQPPAQVIRNTLGPTDQPEYKRTVAGIGGEVSADSDRFSKVMGAAANSQSGIALADQVSSLAGQVRTGQLSKDWADRLAVLQQANPQITARQMLSKYAAQLQTLAEGNAASDAERAQIKSGMPDPDSMDPGAVRKAAQYLHGYFRMAQDRGRNAYEHVTKNGVPGLTLNDTQFSSQRDPLVYAFRDMPRADQKEFLLGRFGHGKSQALDEFETRVKGQP